ncbi:ribosome biogenesis GTP-binding protein YihA/YsxC [Buchnera aphidicola (Pemphigus obesinymphae)]|uniref:ribosome biogenesis GTP-binding protein YihA/YsxC n=1 Tax=Buchnera aphidicola TaxID=9 RepID=UPI0022384A22|nr:ribosome biogenesis GTP-binding protein YihA/YsxC [Buchnera aphidicola]MCW5196855.1 ribosome biogenesis GTP-binding protein YihA/YsxC [Buchnera aphidicola (Pemphigus obesinymphae)]
MFKNNYENTYFLTSTAIVKKQRNSDISEVAFVGYSNSGKSTAINILTNKKKLARISKTPGRTQLINYFAVSKKKYLVDMPGYGYAKAAKLLKLEWEKTIIKYFKIRASLKGLVLFMDIRNPMKKLDENIIHFALRFRIPLLILLTKSDKITLEKRRQKLQIVSEKLSKFSLTSCDINLFSAVHKTGVYELREKLDSWYNE